MSQQTPSFFPTPAIVSSTLSSTASSRLTTPRLMLLQDHAFAGLGAGVVAVLCMHPLDLLKIKFQVATDRPRGGLGKQIWYSLKDIKTEQGWRGLYRGVGPNIAGNASSWGLYFLL